MIWYNSIRRCSLWCRVLLGNVDIPGHTVFFMWKNQRRGYETPPPQPARVKIPTRGSGKRAFLLSSRNQKIAGGGNWRSACSSRERGSQVVWIINQFHDMIYGCFCLEQRINIKHPPIFKKLRVTRRKRLHAVFWFFPPCGYTFRALLNVLWMMLFNLFFPHPCVFTFRAV